MHRNRVSFSIASATGVALAFGGVSAFDPQQLILLSSFLFEGFMPYPFIVFTLYVIPP